jgi:hypothetical protein
MRSFEFVMQLLSNLVILYGTGEDQSCKYIYKFQFKLSSFVRYISSGNLFGLAIQIVWTLL